MNGMRRVIRYRLGERVVHSVTALSYVYLLVTGLAFWTPALYWMAALGGGGFASRMLHPWVGVAFTGVFAWMFVIWRRDMRTAPEDYAWRRAIGHYIRNEDAKVPPIGRFNPGQKQFFWLMAIASVALLLSGLVLWFTDTLPLSWRLVRYTAVLVHAVSALTTIGLFIVHIYMGVFVVPGGMRAVVHGDVSEAWAKAHHALWHRALRPGDFVAPPESGTVSHDVSLSK